MFSWLKTVIQRSSSYPPGPAGVTIYAVGDIHGRLDCLAQAHRLIDQDTEKEAVGIAA